MTQENTATTERPIIFDGYSLVKSNGQPVLLREVVEDRRGEKAVITGGRPPQKISSTGRVWTEDGREYFPHVFGMKWVFKS